MVHLEDVSCLLLVSPCPGGGADAAEPDAHDATAEVPAMVPPQDVGEEELEEEEPFEDDTQVDLDVNRSIWR